MICACTQGKCLAVVKTETGNALHESTSEVIKKKIVPQQMVPQLNASLIASLFWLFN